MNPRTGILPRIACVLAVVTASACGSTVQTLDVPTEASAEGGGSVGSPDATLEASPPADATSDTLAADAVLPKDGTLADSRSEDAGGADEGTPGAEATPEAGPTNEAGSFDAPGPDASVDAPPDAALTDAQDDADAGSTCVDCGGGTCVDLQTDRANCGACGNFCLVPDCRAGRCNTTPLYVGNDLGFPYDLAVDSTNVYFTMNSDGLVLRVPIVPIDGGAAVTLASDPSALRVAVDATNVYWTDLSAVKAAPLGGGAITTIASSAGASGIAVDAWNVYWNTALSGLTGTVMRTGLDGGGSPVTLAQAQDAPQELRVNSAAAYWVNGDIYGVGTDAGSVLSVPLDGGPPESLYGWENQGVNAIALDSAYVYFNDSGRQQLMKEPLAGGPPITLATGIAVVDIAVDATGIYCADRGANAITRVPLDGGTAVLVANSYQAPMRLALDSQYVYWTDFADLILKAPK